MLKAAFPVEPSAVPFQGLPFLLIQKVEFVILNDHS